MDKEIKYIDAGKIPQERLDSMAGTLVEAVRRAFEDPAFAARFEAWKAAREKAAQAS